MIRQTCLSRVLVDEQLARLSYLTEILGGCGREKEGNSHQTALRVTQKRLIMT